MIKRLPINVKLFNEKGEMLQSINSTKISRVMAILRAFAAQNGKYDHGTCRIWYSKSGDYWNEFEFKNNDQLYKLYLVDTEPKYLRSLLRDKTLEVSYTNKRSMSAKQLMVAKRNMKKLREARI